ncbi:MAG: hypothetical protein SFX73_15980 [Kofleriaceae bacterium]|nr:hypothetical protein [Kofleriaceae bacterium]
MRPAALLFVVATACSDPPGGQSTIDASSASDARASDAATDGANDAAQGVCAMGQAPSSEVCDGLLDENCDGMVDEGCTMDAFDPASCGGPPMTSADAIAALAGGARTVLANATIQQRTRACPGGTCGAWGQPADWVLAYLTYSGGVTTRYKNVLMSMALVVFDDGGMPKLSMQHITFPAGGYDDDQGAVYGFPPAPIMYTHLRAYNTAPTSGSDYLDLDYMVTNGTLQLGTRCARFTANPFGTGQPYTSDYAALFRW